MRITYRQLKSLLETMSDDSLDCDVTVEDTYINQCYSAELRVAGTNHDSLEEGHPVLCFGMKGMKDGDLRLKDSQLDWYIKNYGLKG